MKINLPEYRVESVVVTDPRALEKDWLELQQRADCSFFQSWGWIGTWLEHIAADLKPVAIKIWSDGHLVGLALFVTGNIERRGIIRSKVMFLNEYPLDGRNMVIEYNGLLAARGCEKPVYEKTVRFLLNEFKEHDEFMFGAITEETCFDGLFKAQVNNARFFINESSQSWFVDLASIADGIDGYLASISKNRRAQIRRSIRLYGKQGLLQIKEARNKEEAQVFFDGLKLLHTHRWHNKGQPGSFANPRWEAFHRALIENCFDAGEIQLLRISNGSTELGYLYNFVWRKHVYVLQTGFKIFEDKRLMPGYVVHVLAIAYNKEKGMKIYDLMHGDNLYKRILCKKSKKLDWVVLQRYRLNFVVEKIAVDVVRGLRRISIFGN